MKENFMRQKAVLNPGECHQPAHHHSSIRQTCVVAGWFCASRGEVDRMAKEFPDDATSAAVIGCGPVGLMAILAAQAQGAQKVSFAP